MNITNPTNFGIPGLTLTTSNVEGTGNAIRTGASILAFDATDPAAVAASAVVGSATVSARRDHVHSGVAGAGTVVDEAIARFNGTGGATIQGYSSLSPTISDAGIISLTSGALAFPSTAITSANVNTLDDYEEGSWTPVIWDAGLTNRGNAYTTTAGRYTKIGNLCYINFKIESTNISGLTTTDVAAIGQLPFTSANIANLRMGTAIGGAEAMVLGTAGFIVSGYINPNEAYIKLNLNDLTTGNSRLLISEWGANGFMSMTGVYIV